MHTDQYFMDGLIVGLNWMIRFSLFSLDNLVSIFKLKENGGI